MRLVGLLVVLIAASVGALWSRSPTRANLVENLTRRAAARPSERHVPGYVEAIASTSTPHHVRRGGKPSGCCAALRLSTPRFLTRAPNVLDFMPGARSRTSNRQRRRQPPEHPRATRQHPGADGRDRPDRDPAATRAAAVDRSRSPLPRWLPRASGRHTLSTAVGVRASTSPRRRTRPPLWQRNGSSVRSTCSRENTAAQHGRLTAFEQDRDRSQRGTALRPRVETVGAEGGAVLSYPFEAERLPPDRASLARIAPFQGMSRTRASPRSRD